MPSLREVCDVDNILRAWRWIRSNPDARYKLYCGNAYSSFALADVELISGLQDKMKRKIYEPCHSTKIYLPKRSGILRPYTILTVEDQIAYQSLVNVVAEHLLPHVKARYNVSVFGHLYAGRTSGWFYRKWTDGYRAFNNSARAAFKGGRIFAASFDLTAYYDSIDHAVLRHFLKDLALDHEFCDLLIHVLRHWTATEGRIYQGHGIPQGPLGSGLLSEVVLQYFDSRFSPRGSVTYLRYVDDIRLFASSEHDLRKAIVQLDHLSKDIGLFPQASKIELHRVTDIESELKSISNPPEPSVKWSFVDQVKLRDRILDLTPRFEITDETRFKYLLGSALPHSRLNARFLRIWEQRPDLTSNFTRYFARYKRLPASVSKQMISRIKAGSLYDNVTSDIIRALDGRLSPSDEAVVCKMLKRQWTTQLHSELRAVIGEYLISRSQISEAQAIYATQHRRNWWERKELVARADNRCMSLRAVERIFNERIQDEIDDVALKAAEKILQWPLTLTTRATRINHAAACVLRKMGVIRGKGKPIDGVEANLGRILSKGTGVNWKQVFGTDHRQAENQAAFCRAMADTNITGFVNALDVFNDLLLNRLYAHDPSLGGYGGIGAVIGSTRLKTRYPAVAGLVESVHDQRYASLLSHAKQKRTGRPTRSIRYSYLKVAKSLLRAACSELAARW